MLWKATDTAEKEMQNMKHVWKRYLIVTAMTVVLGLSAGCGSAAEDTNNNQNNTQDENTPDGNENKNNTDGSQVPAGDNNGTSPDTNTDMNNNGTDGNSNMNGSSKAMLYMMPLMTVWMGYILPAALCVYWIANAAFSCIQEQVLNKHFSKVLDREETDKERQKREARYAKMQAARENYNRQLEQQAQSKGGKKPQPQPKKKKTGESTTEAGKVGNRPYARGRAYREEHYDE